MGVPVVTSAQAAGGVDAEVGKHFLVAKSPEEYATAIIKLFDPGERDKISVAGRQRVVSHHDWDASMQRLDQLLEQCIKNYANNK